MAVDDEWRNYSIRLNEFNSIYRFPLRFFCHLVTKHDSDHGEVAESDDSDDWGDWLLGGGVALSLGRENCSALSVWSP
jgi:hypothetical protein